MSLMNVPFADLHQQYLSLKPDIDEAIAAVIARSAFIRGPYVEAFEESFAAAMGARHCVSCANGTDALYIAMRALGVRPGDEVVTTAHSWIATSETITQAGAQVVFCDTDTRTFTIDVKALESKITSRTVGIIPVHMAGQPADMDAIMKIAGKHNLWVVEDCAQAHLATCNGRMVGTFGAAATFSFYPGKNLGAMGDAGAIVTGDDALAKHMGMFARHGGLVKGEHLIEGINSRIDGLQAAILQVKLPRLAAWTERRREIAARYDRALGGLNALVTPWVAEGRNPVYHLYMIRHENRDALAQSLAAAGVQTVINYPTSLPFLAAYASMRARPEDYPNAHHDQSRILSLPIYPEMTEHQVSHVIDSVTRHATMI